MEIELAFLADAAQETAGKLNALGIGIDQILADQVPSFHPVMYLVLKIALQPIECDRPHQMEIVLWDPDGQIVGPQLNGQFSASRRADDPLKVSYAQVVVSMIGQRFPREGDYAFHIVIDGQEKKTLPLTIRLKRNN